MKSMTGYAKVQSTVGDKKLNIEIKTLNSKQLDLIVKLPAAYRSRELDIRALLAPLERGKVEFTMTEESGSSEAVLNELIDVFSAFLKNTDNAKYVDSIVISGHTASTGTEEDNRILSTDRANSVLNYLLAGKNGALANYAEYFCAAGYGETRPVASNDTSAGQAQNRRTEISMILKDETVLDIVEQYLALDLPESDSPSAQAKPSTAAPAATPEPTATPSPTPKSRWNLFG